MPFLALKGGEEVIPPQVEGDTELHCPVCGRRMYVTRSHYRGDAFISRHFTHTPDGLAEDGGNWDNGGNSDCPGESSVHAKMKSIAYARLQDDYPEATVELERRLNSRIPDVLATFPKPRSPFGEGIAVEAQYRNKGKDKEAVTKHYFDNSYSVAWLEKDDFSTHDVDLSGILTLWPHKLPDRRGTEGYPDVVRWLLQEKNPTVEMEIPIPGEFWSSFDKTGEWITVAEARVKHKGTLSISKSPTGSIVLGLSKATLSGGEGVQIKAAPADADKLRSFADDLDRVAFGSERPPPRKRDPEWHELAQTWLTGVGDVTGWLSASLPTPTSSVVLQLGKKRGDESETVSMKAKPYSSDSFWLIAGLLEDVFEIERGEQSFRTDSTES